MSDLPYNINTKSGVTFFSCKLLDRVDFLLHAFSSRQTGVSEGAYSTLNLSGAVGDAEESVEKNRRLFYQVQGIKRAQVFSVNQVHGNNVLIIDERLLARRQNGRPEQAVSADAMLTDQPGVALTVLTADCLPIIIVDPQKKAVAMVHAGWRGTCRGILQKTLAKLAECFGGNPNRWLIGMGPCISSCCYEVGSDVVSMFKQNYPDWHNYCTYKKEDKWDFDLLGANMSQLLTAGVRPENICELAMCTACHPEHFFSYRKTDGKTGRMMSLVMLK
jgi:YfiH family protein